MLASSIQQCPVCSRVVTFSSIYTNIITCSSCGSTINRNPDGALVSKPHFPIIDNPDIIQPGTTGKWEGKSFTVIGRFRTWFEESVFSYWTIEFEDGQTLWLGEGYGIYSILTLSTKAQILSSKELKSIEFGHKQDLGYYGSFVLEKRYTTLKWETQGELYIPDNKATIFNVTEFSNAKNVNLTYFDFSNDNVVAYEVVYISFDSLQLGNLRPYTPTPKSFSCENCSNTVEVKTYPYAQSCACTGCGTQYRLKQDMSFAKARNSNQATGTRIRLGSTGVIKGIMYEVIGYVEKEEDNQYHSKWREYTLFNPQEGYAFLSEYNGNWIYVRETCNSPVLLFANHHNITFDYKNFRLFNSYTYKINDAQGEFPYNIYDNKYAKVKEFIAPPEVWMHEWDREEGITWFHGEHISGKEVVQAYPQTELPYKTGIGAVQPAGGSASGYKLFLALVTGILLLVLIHSRISATKHERELFSHQFVFESENQVSFVTDKYVFDKDKSNVRFDISAPVDNNWFELNATLVNVETGKEYSLEKGIEQYSGYSDGGSWSEGSSSGTAYLTRIPKGVYIIQLAGTRENSPYITGLSNIVNYFNVTITYDVPNNRNLIWSIVLLLIWPLIRSLINYFSERARWAQSPYNPYSNE